MRLEGMDDFLKSLKKFDTKEKALSVVEPAMLAMAESVRTKLATYPGPVKYPLKYKSEAQRRYVMARTSKYGYYRRIYDPKSQRLKESWTTEKEADGRYIVGTKVTYAPFVQSKEAQQPMHKATGWITEDKAIEAVQRSAVFERALDMAMKKAI